MSKPIRWQDLLIGNLCQVTVDKWNSIVKWVNRQEVVSLIINDTKANITSGQNGTQISMTIPVGGSAESKCTALVGRVGDGEICVTPGIISIPPDVQDTGPGGVPLANVSPGGTPVYETHDIQLTVDDKTFDLLGTPICISPFDTTADCLLLKLEFRGGDETANPTANPNLVVPPGEIVALNIESAPFNNKPPEQACKEAKYDDNGAQTTQEQNGIIYWPLYDARQSNPQVMCGNMQLYYCGGCSWQLFSLPGNVPNN